MKNEKNIAVLITCHNRKYKTYKCLKNLLQAKTRGINIKIFLVNDGSSNGTSIFLKKKKIKNLTIIKGSGKLYWGGGTNLAWINSINSKYKFDYFLWLNNDTYLFKHALKNLIEAEKFLETDTFICVGTTINNQKKRTYGGYKNLGSKFAKFKNTMIFPNQTFQLIDRFNGNIVLISKKAHKKNGIIDKNLIHYFGDIDYGIKAFKKKIPVVLSPYNCGICIKDNKNINFSDFFFGKKLIPNGYNFIKKNGGVFWLIHFASFLITLLKERIGNKNF